MTLYRPSELHHFLKTCGGTAKKGLSQNFLIDGNIVRKIVHMAGVHPGDRVIEIGPGPGVLTETLLERGAHVTAIEMDPLFAQTLTRLQQQPQHSLDVICQDFLTFSLERFFQQHPTHTYKVIANLPYHITTPILVQLLPHFPKISSLTIMVQKEFADRMMAKANTTAYSSFTLFLDFFSDIVSHYTVNPSCFYPRPTVHSSIIHCALHPPLLAGDTTPFFSLVRTAFQQRRKMLRSTLKSLLPIPIIEAALHQLGKLPTIRPEELSIDEWIGFYTETTAISHSKEGCF